MLNTTLTHIFSIVVVTTTFVIPLYPKIRTSNHSIPEAPMTNRSCTTCTNGEIFVVPFVKLDIIFTFIVSLFANKCHYIWLYIVRDRSNFIGRITHRFYFYVSILFCFVIFLSVNLKSIFEFLKLVNYFVRVPKQKMQECHSVTLQKGVRWQCIDSREIKIV